MATTRSGTDRSRGRSPTERPGDTVGRAYTRLLELILEGTYLPGRRLSQHELSQQVGVGRTPLREALRLLEADGFVVSTANRGVAVAPAELGSAEELYAVFRELVWPAYKESGAPPEALREVLERLKPLSIASLVTAYEVAMDDTKREGIARRTR